MEDDILRIIKERRSVRYFKDEAPPPDAIDGIIEAAVWAPSSCNRQPWHFIVAKDKRVKDILADSVGGQETLKRAPVIIVICIRMSAYWNLGGNIAPFMDTGATMQNILLAAHALGLGACPVAGRIKDKIVRAELGIPDDYRVTGYVALGYPDEQPTPPERRGRDRYYSTDAFQGRMPDGAYSRVGLKRGRVARLGADISVYYEYAREKAPIFRYARERVAEITKGHDSILYTYAAMGYFLTDEKVDCLVSSKDERWFLETFKGLRNRLHLVPSIDDLASIPERYGCIVSFFDVHFLDDGELTRFYAGVKKCLEAGGELILVFLNANSPYGLNYRLARLLGADYENARPCGYERPLGLRTVTGGVPKDEFGVVSVRTGLFCPPANIAYRSRFVPHIPYGLSTSLEFLRHIPLVNRTGNVAIVELLSI